MITTSMVTKFSLRSNSLAFTNLSPAHFLVFPKGSFFKLPAVSQFSTPTQTINTRTVPYGPSLHKGKIPSQQQQQQPHSCPYPYGPRLLPDQCKEDDSDEDNILDEEKFTRAFDIAALRVPAKCSCALESRLRGHLLNWPRIRNIARVTGDEVEENMVSLLGDTRNGDGNEEADRENLVRFRRRIYGKAEGDGERLSPVLYREKLANEFNSRGFVEFRNLAKISRPKRKKKKEGGNGEERNGRKSKKCALVEVVEKEEGEVWNGLLGNDFKGSQKWKGSTRLLLLDERYAENGVEQLPQAIKVANPNSLLDYMKQ
uniref:Uncharacterized protein MANES_15G081500 n=1 Tax=Rhizophora mucronata TaxID=61149 RepID=A0A2P2L0U0_RHIMU